MRLRTFGDTHVTAVGSGDVCLTRSAGRGVDAGEVERALQEAIALGVALVDVADDAEPLVGATLRATRARDRIVVATRVAAVPSALALAKTVQARIEASLRATRLDALPLVQLPLRVAWVEDRAWPELADVCARLVREGKVMRWGALVDDEDAIARTPGEAAAGEPAAPVRVAPDDLALAALATLDGNAPSADDVRRALAAAANQPRPAGLILSIHDVAAAPPPPPTPPVEPGGPAALVLCVPWIAALSVRLDLCDRRAAPLVDAAKLPVLVRHPLAGGALAGVLGAGVELRVRDDRRAIDDATLARIAVGLATLARYVREVPPAARSTVAGQQRIEQLERLEPVECRDVAELALRFAIDRGGHTIALPRLHRFDHLRAAVAAASAPPLGGDLLAELAKLDI